MHNHHDVHGRLPPAVVYGAYDQPLHSWRVLILPYLEEQELYEQFKLEEPWDSPHNIQLLSKMPRIYAPPSGKASRVPAYHTVCHVFVGPGTPFDGRAGLRLKDDFPLGTSHTFLIVEAGEPVPWTKPEELPYAPDQPLPNLHCLFHDGFRARLVDCSGRFIRKDISERSLRAAITRNTKDQLGQDWDD